MSVNVYSLSNETLLLAVKAVPGASKTEAMGVKDGRLRLRIAAAPEDGKANAELVSFLARRLGCGKKDIALAAGEKSRLKTIALPQRLEPALRGFLGLSYTGTHDPA